MDKNEKKAPLERFFSKKVTKKNANLKFQKQKLL
jgi:hypothetical protein